MLENHFNPKQIEELEHLMRFQSGIIISEAEVKSKTAFVSDLCERML